MECCKGGQGRVRVFSPYAIRPIVVPSCITNVCSDQLSEQRSYAEPSGHQTHHPTDARLQGLPLRACHSEWHRDHAYDRQRTDETHWQNQSAACQFYSLVMQTILIISPLYDSTALPRQSPMTCMTSLFQRLVRPIGQAAHVQQPYPTSRKPMGIEADHCFGMHRT